MPTSLESHNHKFTLQQRIGLTALTIVAIHVVLSLSVIFAGKVLPRNKIVTFYSQLMVLGPFFTESRIKSSHYLTLRYKREGTWSNYRAYGKEHFLHYSRNPWRYDMLPYQDYEKRLCYEVGNLAMNKPFEHVRENASFRELNEFILEDYIRTPVDSINLIYGLHVYSPHSKTHVLDTIFNYTYNPNTLGKTKRKGQ